MSTAVAADGGYLVDPQTAATIKSDGPLTIESGETFENLDLTLKPSGRRRRPSMQTSSLIPTELQLEVISMRLYSHRRRVPS